MEPICGHPAEKLFSPLCRRCRRRHPPSDPKTTLRIFILPASAALLSEREREEKGPVASRERPSQHRAARGSSKKATGRHRSSAGFASVTSSAGGPISIIARRPRALSIERALLQFVVGSSHGHTGVFCFAGLFCLSSIVAHLCLGIIKENRSFSQEQKH